MGAHPAATGLTRITLSPLLYYAIIAIHIVLPLPRAARGV
ncbi:hypothetical protein WG78_04410 [Amantichitinum ursilacus]|uniref:Uncharacterized protein n=1 Tax=Amantichitinum ursilacus TaxID=857265 RepID=A0A0N0XL46_9NEIS|nr:hypothetical protein WG78_04410 [Amantichitinum ursilacus]